MVLGYGDHPELLGRCLESLVTRPHARLDRLTIALNAPSDRTYGEALRWLRHLRLTPNALHASRENRRKYPVMRDLLRKDWSGSEFVMWFDDDSCLRPETSADWWDDVYEAARDMDFVGRRLYCGLGGAQAAYVRSRPWYRGVPVVRGWRVPFPVGGWWVARRSVLLEHDWPPPDLGHNGGDVMLGALIQQQGLRFHHWHHGVAVNADEQLRDDKCPRRGVSEPPLGSDYVEKSNRVDSP